MRAALVTSFAEPPHHADAPEPGEPGPGQALVDVLAVGLHPRVRSGAAGTHYASTAVLPLIPGVDGVGRLTDGSLVYFVADDDLPGPMAQQTLVDLRRTVPLPAHTDPALIAATMNPAMSSWVALRRRVALEPGQRVLVLGAGGNAGTTAVQVARHLGASLVIGAGRDVTRLAACGADVVCGLDEGLGEVASEVDVVLDYLWGAPAVAAMTAILTARSDRSRALDWIQIGSVAGPDAVLPSVLLRSANLRVQGVGQGSVSGAGYVGELPSLVAEISAGTFGTGVRTRPLAEVTEAWATPDRPGERTVLIPG